MHFAFSFLKWMLVTQVFSQSRTYLVMEGRRLQNYKNKGNTTDELRKRREEEGVQIRKNKRNEMLQKRRLCADPPAQQTPPSSSNLVSFCLKVIILFWMLWLLLNML